jgi:hypothetical protein
MNFGNKLDGFQNRFFHLMDVGAIGLPGFAGKAQSRVFAFFGKLLCKGLQGSGFPALPGRMQNEIKTVVDKDSDVRKPRKRVYHVMIGGLTRPCGIEKLCHS